jgi:hypothetical protein
MNQVCVGLVKTAAMCSPLVVKDTDLKTAINVSSGPVAVGDTTISIAVGFKKFGRCKATVVRVSVLRHPLHDPLTQVVQHIEAQNQENIPPDVVSSSASPTSV